MTERAATSTTASPDPRPISWRHNLYALWIAQTLALVGFTLRDAYLPFFLKELGAASTEDATLWSGLVQAGGAGVMVIAAPLWGLVSDRHGRKPMVLRAMFAATLTVGLMGVATAPWHLVALRMVEGALTGTVTACAALVAASAPKDRLGFSLGLIQTAVFSGASIGPFLGGILADQIGYRATFGVSGAALAAAGLIVLLFVRERFTPPPRGSGFGVGGWGRWMRRGAPMPHPPTPNPRPPTPNPRPPRWFLAPTVLTMVVALFVVRFAQMGVRPIMPLYVEQLGDLTDERAASLSGLAFGLLGLTSALAAISLGRRGDRVGHRRILLWCTLGAGLLYLPMAFVAAPWQLVALQALFGVAAGGLIPAANAIVAHVTPPERRGAVFGVTAAASSLGGFAGPLAAAAVAAAFGFRATFACTAVILLALTAALSIPSLRRTPLSHQPPPPLRTGGGDEEELPSPAVGRGAGGEG